MAQIVEAIEGISEACRYFDTPITGGNVSLYNETLGEAIWPSPVMGIVGLMKTAEPVTIPFKRQGLTVVLLGGLGSCDAEHFGGTKYAKVFLNKMWGLPPGLDMEYEKRVQAAIREIVNEGHAESAHDVSDGGLAVALAECTVNGVGASVEIASSLRPEFMLFHEGPSRILLSTAVPASVEEIARKHNVEALRIGVTMNTGLRIGDGSAVWIDSPLDRLKQVWENALAEQLAPVHA
jgi:phosphoribosylformylglycinamidine synthase